MPRLSGGVVNADGLQFYSSEYANASSELDLAALKAREMELVNCEVFFLSGVVLMWDCTAGVNLADCRLQDSGRTLGGNFYGLPLPEATYLGVV
jgi:hypothetical protein